MERIGCLFNDCCEEAKYSCKCESPEVYLCNAHVLDHMSKISNSHSISPLYFVLMEEDIQKLKRAKSRLLRMRNTAMKQTITLYNSKVSEALKECSLRMEMISEVLSPLIAKIDESIITSVTRNSEIDALQMNICESQELDESLNKILIKYINKQGCLNPSVFFSSEIPNSIEFQNRFSYSFIKNDKKIVKVDNHNLTGEHIMIESLPDNLGFVAGICQLDNENIFYCGGCTNSYISCCYQINVRTLEWQKYPDMPFRNANIAPLRIYNDIYVFGGYADDYKKNVIKFSLLECTWEKVSEMPFASHSVYPVQVNEDCVLIAGPKLRGIYSYSLASNTYDKVFESSNDRCVLFKVINGNLYFLTKGKIYESSVYDFKSWNEVGTYTGTFSNCENCPQEYGDFVYLKMEGTNNYKRFNFKTYKLESLKINF